MVLPALFSCTTTEFSRCLMESQTIRSIEESLLAHLPCGMFVICPKYDYRSTSKCAVQLRLFCATLAVGMFTYSVLLTYEVFCAFPLFINLSDAYWLNTSRIEGSFEASIFDPHESALSFHQSITSNCSRLIEQCQVWL